MAEPIETREWRNDEGLFGLAREELYTAVVGDICDQYGLRHQFLPPEIRPLNTPSKSVLIGRAMPVLEADVFQESDATKPFGKMLQALDDLRRNEVYLCAGSSPRYALVGELMATAMLARGAVGAVVDGYVRDTHGILEVGLSTFSRGPYAQDQRGRGIVLDYRVPIEIGGVSIRPGDIIVGDIDGVLVVPAEWETEVFAGALTKARAEKTVQKAIAKGMSATEAFATYGIL